MERLSLYELNNLVRGTIECAFGREYWLAAELSEVRVGAGGHCYVEFVEKSVSGNALVAKARGNIWRGTYNLLSAHFERATGQSLQAGMKVLVQVSVTFHELYGYSLNVTDIDPSYTLGDMARRRKEILRQLEDDGVLTLNKELVLPRIPWRIAVISSSTAAGYGDFCDQLSGSGYRFRTRLFPALMQGGRTEQSVIAALDAVAAERDEWDAVAIIRGGGAVSDLSAFDTYPLAANVAQFPLPVLTGIGHERDDTVIDLVAHVRLKTPTAVAAFLIDLRRGEEERQERLEARLSHAVRQCLEGEHRRFESAVRRFQVLAVGVGGRQREHLLRLSARLSVRLHQILHSERLSVEAMPDRVRRAAGLRLERERNRLDNLGRNLRLAGPERILDMGFSITLLDGKVVREALQVRPGDRLVTKLGKGEIHSIAANNITEEK